MSSFVGAALDVFIRSAVLANYTVEVNKLVNFFNVFLLQLDGVLLFVVDSHDFSFAFIDLEAGLLGFLGYSV